MNPYHDIASAEDLPALIELSRADHIEDREALIESIFDVLSTWQYDFYCGKFPDIRNSMFFSGIEAIEHLQSERLYIDRARYFLMVADELRDDNPGQALNWIEQAYQESRLGLASDPGQEPLRLIEIESLFAKLNIPGCKPQPLLARDIFALCAQLATEFPNCRVWETWLFQILKADNPNPVWQDYRELARRLYKSGTLSALRMAEILFRFLPNHPPLAEFSSETRYWLDTAKYEAAADNKSEHDFHSAGHLYDKAARIFNEEWMLQLAITIFSHCAEQYPQSWCPIVYVCQAKQYLVELRSLNRNDTFALYEDIYTTFTHAAIRMPNDFTLMTHACKFLSRYLDIINDPEKQQTLNQQRITWALIAEIQGGGHYWIPYQDLIASYVLLDDSENIEVWTLRGFLVLGLLVEEKLTALVQVDAFRRHFPLRRLLQNVENYFSKLEERVWRGGMDVDRLRAMDLHELRQAFTQYCSNTTN